MKEVFDVLVSRYDTRWDGVVLNNKACPAHGSTRQRRTSMQEWLDSPFTNYLDARKYEGRIG
jgi:hypothetical protein